MTGLPHRTITFLLTSRTVHTSLTFQMLVGSDWHIGDCHSLNILQPNQTASMATAVLVQVRSFIINVACCCTKKMNRYLHICQRKTREPLPYLTSPIGHLDILHCHNFQFTWKTWTKPSNEVCNDHQHTKHSNYQVNSLPFKHRIERPSSNCTKTFITVSPESCFDCRWYDKLTLRRMSLKRSTKT